MNQTNLELKTKLFSQVEVLGKEQSLLPFSTPYIDIDETIRELESVNPIGRSRSASFAKAMMIF